VLAVFAAMIFAVAIAVVTVDTILVVGVSVLAFFAVTAAQSVSASIGAIMAFCFRGSGSRRCSGCGGRSGSYGGRVSLAFQLVDLMDARAFVVVGVFIFLGMVLLTR